MYAKGHKDCTPNPSLVEKLDKINSRYDHLLNLDIDKLREEIATRDKEEQDVEEYTLTFKLYYNPIHGENIGWAVNPDAGLTMSGTDSIEDTKAQLAAWIDEFVDEVRDEVDEVKDEQERAVEALENVQKALEFYANEENDDGGEYAGEILEQLNETIHIIMAAVEGREK